MLGTPWELGNNREYGHMSLLFRMLEETDKLDIAENHPGSDKMSEITQASLSTIALQQVLTKIEALQWCVLLPLSLCVSHNVAVLLSLSQCVCLHASCTFVCLTMCAILMCGILVTGGTRINSIRKYKAL